MLPLGVKVLPQSQSAVSRQSWRNDGKLLRIKSHASQAWKVNTTSYVRYMIKKRHNYQVMRAEYIELNSEVTQHQEQNWKWTDSVVEAHWATKKVKEQLT